jgi:hypothetical protein
MVLTAYRTRRYYTSYIIPFFCDKINVYCGKIFSFGDLHNIEVSLLCILPIQIKVRYIILIDDVILLKM